ncbi:hypothetical protein N2152v2_005040 [Parachlorella kessleri]
MLDSHGAGASAVAAETAGEQIVHKGGSREADAKVATASKGTQPHTEAAGTTAAPWACCATPQQAQQGTSGPAKLSGLQCGPSSPSRTAEQQQQQQQPPGDSPGVVRSANGQAALVVVDLTTLDASTGREGAGASCAAGAAAPPSRSQSGLSVGVDVAVRAAVTPEELREGAVGLAVQARHMCDVVEVIPAPAAEAQLSTRPLPFPTTEAAATRAIAVVDGLSIAERQLFVAATKESPAVPDEQHVGSVCKVDVLVSARGADVKWGKLGGGLVRLGIKAEDHAAGLNMLEAPSAAAAEVDMDLGSPVAEQPRATAAATSTLPKSLGALPPPPPAQPLAALEDSQPRPVAGSPAAAAAAAAAAAGTSMVPVSQAPGLETERLPGQSGKAAPSSCYGAQGCHARVSDSVGAGAAGGASRCPAPEQALQVPASEQQGLPRWLSSQPRSSNRKRRAFAHYSAAALPAHTVSADRGPATGAAAECGKQQNPAPSLAGTSCMTDMPGGKAEPLPDKAATTGCAALEPARFAQRLRTVTPAGPGGASGCPPSTLEHRPPSNFSQLPAREGIMVAAAPPAVQHAASAPSHTYAGRVVLAPWYHSQGLAPSAQGTAYQSFFPAAQHPAIPPADPLAGFQAYGGDAMQEPAAFGASLGSSVAAAAGLGSSAAPQFTTCCTGASHSGGSGCVPTRLWPDWQQRPSQPLPPQQLAQAAHMQVPPPTAALGPVASIPEAER